MVINRCPGQDMRFWSADDITEKECPSCGYQIEFMKFDLVRDCPECGKTTVNPQFNLECAEWCEHASECLGQTGNILEGIKTIKSEVQEKLEQIFSEQPDLKDHCYQVAELAEKIGKHENVNMLTVVLTALLHEFKLNDGSENCRASQIMDELDIPDNIKQEVLNNIENLGQTSELLSFHVVNDAHMIAQSNNDRDLREKIQTEGAKKVVEL